MVGEVIQVLAERNFISDADELIPLQKDLLKRNLFNGNNYSVVGLATAVMQPNIACSLWEVKLIRVGA
jgi:hypothetical protein